MAYFHTKDGQQIYYESQGNGEQAIVLIHGSFMNSSVWDHQARSFADTYQVVRIDLRGHGESDKPATGYNYNRYGKDVMELVTHLSINSFVLVGWSMGAIVALKFVEDNPEIVDKLGLVSTGMFHQVSDKDQREDEYIPYEEFMTRIQSERPEAMEWFIESISSEQLGEATKQWLWNLAMDSAIQANVETMEAASQMDATQMREVLESLQIPVGIFHGEQDRSASIEEAKFISEHLVSDGTLFSYDESKHIPFLSESNKFDADLHKFIRE